MSTIWLLVITKLVSETWSPFHSKWGPHLVPILKNLGPYSMWEQCMRDVKLQSILSCSKGRSWHLGGFSGHSFSKELRLISSFHHLENDMAIKAYTIKCQNYHKKTFRHAKWNSDVNLCQCTTCGSFNTFFLEVWTFLCNCRVVEHLI